MLTKKEQEFQKIYMEKIQKSPAPAGDKNLLKTATKINALNDAYAKVLANEKPVEKFKKEM
jgi:hypothetical protein